MFHSAHRDISFTKIVSKILNAQNVVKTVRPVMENLNINA